MLNLETPITRARRAGTPRSWRPRATASTSARSDRALDVLADAGVDVVSVANNHAGDYGQVGLADTLGRGA